VEAKAESAERRSGEEAPVLELRRLSKDYPGHRAVDSVSLSIPAGTFFSLLGPSGCGKTTTLRLIGGFEEPTEGEVFLCGQMVNGRKPYERNVSTVFQSYALFPHLSAAENIAFGLRRRKSPAAEIARRVGEALNLVSLDGKGSRRPAGLSGGERQRVALARSLVLEPDVLLLDEPLAALDPKLRQQMRHELKAIERSVGITFLLVTHDQEEALSLSDCVAVMNNGRIEQIGTPEEVYLRPRTRFVASFLGEMNWINGVGVRPEATRVEQAVSEGPRSLPAVVTGSVFLGDRIQVRLQLASGEEVKTQMPRTAGVFRAGDSVRVCWEVADEMHFE
jgi:ABC-type Fe3+/spermidine/putrescine transport system ATPase subunit